jgi:hypothetical protein
MAALQTTTWRQGIWLRQLASAPPTPPAVPRRMSQLQKLPRPMLPRPMALHCSEGGWRTRLIDQPPHDCVLPCVLPRFESCILSPCMLFAFALGISSWLYPNSCCQFSCLSRNMSVLL